MIDEKDHEYYKNMILSYENCKKSLPGIIRAFLIVELLKEYMKAHFISFDMEAMEEIKKIGGKQREK